MTTHLFIAVYLMVLVIALLLNEPVTVVFTLLCGFATFSMYQYGGERLHRFLDRIM